MSTPSSLAAWAARQPNRCPNGYDLAAQHPGLCDCQRAAARKTSGIAATNGATPIDVKARIDAAIRKWAASGREFSANDLRHEFGVTGPVVGGRFNAAARAGLIRDTGRRVPSTKGSTNGHEVRVWIGLT